MCDTRLRGDRCDQHRVPPSWHELQNARKAAETELRRAENAARAARDLIVHIGEQETARRVYERQLQAQEQEVFKV
jgi:N6-adenosine-specific RNA methylase IME4